MRFLKNQLSLILIILLTTCTSSAAPAIGEWDLNINTLQGVQEAILSIAGNGTGTFIGDQGNQTINGVMLDGNAISFDLNIEAQGQSLSLSFAGEVNGDTLNGEMQTPLGALLISGIRR